METLISLCVGQPTLTKNTITFGVGGVTELGSNNVRENADLYLGFGVTEGCSVQIWQSFLHLWGYKTDIVGPNSSQ